MSACKCKQQLCRVGTTAYQVQSQHCQPVTWANQRGCCGTERGFTYPAKYAQRGEALPACHFFVVCNVAWCPQMTAQICGLVVSHQEILLWYAAEGSIYGGSTLDI